MKAYKNVIVVLMVLLGTQSIFAQENATVKETFKKTMKIEGRIMYDFDFLSAGNDYSFSGSEFRRVRLAAKGKIAKNVGYKVEFDFAGGAVNFRDVFIKYSLPNKLGAIKAGSFTEPSSLNNMTSSKYITFFERAMLANTQPFKYNSGFMYTNHNLFGGKVGLEMAYTFNGDKHTAFKDKSLDAGDNFIGRAFGTILNNKEKNQIVHLGVNYEHRSDNADDYKYDFRVENHMGDKYEVAVGTDFKNTSDVGFELATTFGPLSIQGEYEISSNVAKGDTYTTNAYYAFASFFLTGEHRPYKNGTFGRVKPKKDFCAKDKSLGAIELAVRYSVIDFSNFPGVTKNESISDITLGLNWYLNNHARIIYNFTTADFHDLELYGKDNLNGHLIRFQVDF